MLYALFYFILGTVSPHAYLYFLCVVECAGECQCLSSLLHVEPPSPSDVNATLTLQGNTTVANFTWKQVTDNCTDDVTLKYRLTTNNCGSCSSSMDTDDNMIICDGIGPGDQCNISIQSVTPCNAVSVPTKLSITGMFI